MGTIIGGPETLVLHYIFNFSGEIQLRLSDDSWVTPPNIKVELKKIGSEPDRIIITVVLEGTPYQKGGGFSSQQILMRTHPRFKAIWKYYETPETI